MLQGEADPRKYPGYMFEGHRQHLDYHMRPPLSSDVKHQSPGPINRRGVRAVGEGTTFDIVLEMA